MKDGFLKNVEKHVMTVELDNGVYRCLKFGNPDTNVMYFRLTTWPGHLCISGDMGTYVFSRLPDMFQFFRREDGELKINTGYWMQKLQAISCYGSKEGQAVEFDGEGTAESIKSVLNDNEGQLEKWKDQLERIAEASDASEAIRIIEEIDDISDYWEYPRTKPTFHIQWCLYAILWGIMQYDNRSEMRAA